MATVENLIRSDCEGNWVFHKQSVQEFLPIFTAFDLTNYQRWHSLYLEDMHSLEKTAPEIHQALMERKFAMQRTKVHFRAVGADMALEETINKTQKDISGIIGSSRKKQFVAMWELIYHEMLAISSLHWEMSGVTTSAYDFVVNHKFNKTETVSGETNVQAIMGVTENNENPFQVAPVEVELHNILTQVLLTEDIHTQLLNIKDMGSSAYSVLRKQHLVKMWVRLSATIHRTNLQIFQSICKTKMDGKAKGTLLTQKEHSYKQCLMEVA